MEIVDDQGERDFLLSEVEQVRKSYDEFIEETRRLERYAILVAGTTWGWCASHVDSYAFSLFIWFPAVACGLFGFRAFGIHIQSLAARRYIAKIEGMFIGSRQLGWAHVQMTHSTGIPGVVAFTAYIFWIVLTISTVSIPLVYRAGNHHL